MKNIITAIGNPDINEQLIKNENYNILSKDVQYQDGILEILDKERNVDLIILSNYILGEYDFKLFIEKILFIKENIKIIVLLKNEDADIITFLYSKKIFDVYITEEPKIEELELLINNEDISTQKVSKEIDELKKIKDKKNSRDNNENNYKLNNIIKTIKNIGIKVNKKNDDIKYFEDSSSIDYTRKEIIVISGAFAVREKYFCHYIISIFRKKKCKNTFNRF